MKTLKYKGWCYIPHEGRDECYPDLYRTKNECIEWNSSSYYHADAEDHGIVTRFQLTVEISDEDKKTLQRYAREKKTEIVEIRRIVKEHVQLIGKPFQKDQLNMVGINRYAQYDSGREELIGMQIVAISDDCKSSDGSWDSEKIIKKVEEILEIKKP